MNEILTLIISNLCTGSLSWLFTLKYSRRQAEATAMEQVQRIYQTLVNDIKADRDALREDRESLKAQIADMEKRIADLEATVTLNEKIISKLTKDLESERSRNRKKQSAS
jgi:septal ring factor EnvC (AmiA/AmiB activator)